MKRLLSLGMVLILFYTCNVQSAGATASTHIWAPSTDTQAWGTGHITADVYIPVERNGDRSRARTITNTGLEFGLLPFKKLNAEAGFDYKTGYGDLDAYPMYFNAKIAVPEGTLLPALAIGIYDVGTQKNKTDNDVVYFETAKTFSINDFSLGRFSVGYFCGSDRILVDHEGNKEANGILAAWERTMPEISDKLWVCIEYQGSKSAYGALNLGFSWQFTKDLSVIFGYQFYNDRHMADTATIQVDVNF